MVDFGKDLLAKSVDVSPDYHPNLPELEIEYVRIQREGEGHFAVVKKPSYHNRRDARGRFIK